MKQYGDFCLTVNHPDGPTSRMVGSGTREIGEAAEAVGQL
jgi:hypothetical protein